jgi:hypothetical protein
MFSCMLVIMINTGRNAARLFPQGCIIGMVILLLAIGLMFSTMNNLRHSDYFSCYGGLGAGFPVSFLCDYSGGGSPLSSAGKIDAADFPYFSPLGTLVDTLFYSMHIGVVWFVANSISRKGQDRRRKYGLAALVILMYLAGFFSALILFQPIPLRIEHSYPRTPTPTLYTPTPFGTPPPPAFTPVLTLGP